MAEQHIVAWDDARRRPYPTGFAMPFVNEQTGAERLALHLSVIAPGERAHPPHEHAGEEIMFLLEGEAEALVGDATRVIGPNTAVFCPEHVMHGLRNCGASPMRYLVVRTP